MAHRNKGNGKMPKTNASPRTVRRWRFRHHSKKTIMFSGSNPPHYHIDPNVDPSTGGGGDNSG